MDHPAAIEAIARTVLWALCMGVAQSALLAAAAYGTIRYAHAGATTRHVMWWLVLLASAALPIVSVGASLRHIEHRAPLGLERSARAASAHVDARDERMTIRVTLAPRHATAEAGGATAAAAARAPVALRYGATVAIAAWLAVAAAALVALVPGLCALRRIKRDAEPLDESLLRRLRRLRHSERFGRPVTVSVSNVVDVPVALGFRTPTIVLPVGVVERGEIADIDQIAMHEYAHLNRYDDWTNLVQRAIERLFWFNPIVAIVGRAISLEREIACDDWVVARTGRAHRYATCLWRLVETSQLTAPSVLAPGALLTARQLSIRIEQLLNSRKNALPRLSPFGALAVGSLCMILVVAQALRAPAIAIVDRPAAPLPVVAAQAAPTRAPVPAPSPKPDTIAYLFQAQNVRVRADASPQAVASAVAEAVAEKEHRVVRAIVATRVRAVAILRPAPPARRSARAARARLEGCFGCTLRGIDLRDLDLHGISVVGADLRGADLRGSDLHGASFAGTDLRGVRFGEADLRGVSFAGSDLTGSDLTHASLAGARFVGTSIRGINGSGARLRALVDGCRGCDLRSLDLHGQDLRGIELVGVDLRDADLHDADLSDARLEAVDLRGANVKGLKLDGTVLEHCDLAGLKDLALENPDVDATLVETPDFPDPPERP